MNTKVLCFFGGVILGAASSYFILKKKMDKQIAEEVESVKNVYNCVKAGEKFSQDLINNEKETEGISKETPKETIERNEQIKKDLLNKNNGIIEENKYANTHKTSYNLFSNPPKGKDIKNGVDDDEDLDVIDTTPDKDAPPPYVLENDNHSTAAQKYASEMPMYDKVTLFLFDDGILCSDEEEIITNISNTIGSDALGRIGEYEPDVVYVRNERTCTDYEVIRQYRDFAIIPDEDD